MDAAPRFAAPHDLYSFTPPPPPETLRPHQREAYENIFDHLNRGIPTQICVLPTGAGKTWLATAVAQAFRSTLFVVPRQELLHQAQSSYAHLFNANDIGTIWQDKLDYRGKHFTVAMVQSLEKFIDAGMIDPHEFGAVILDEAHHAAANQWRKVADYFEPRLLLGLSATPERLDGLPLNDIFSTISYNMDIRDAVNLGILVPPVAMQVQTDIDLGHVPTGNSVKDRAELQRAVNTEQRNKIILDTYLKHGQNRKTIGFTAGTKHADELAQLFRRAGVPSISVNGAHKDRAERIQRFEDGEFQVIFNDALLSEGYDHPGIEAVMMCRPTQSRSLYIQCVGRGLRLSPQTGKTDCLILDFHDTSSRIRLVGVWDFWGTKSKKKGQGELREPTNLLEHERDQQAQMEQLAQFWNINAYLERIDVLEPPPEIDPFVLGQAEWHAKEATEKQLATLAELGYDATLRWTRGQASSVIGQQPPTDKQLSLLLAFGYDVVGFEWTKGAATTAIQNALDQKKKPDWSINNALQKRKEPHTNDLWN